MRSDTHDEANSRFLLFANAPKSRTRAAQSSVYCGWGKSRRYCVLRQRAGEQISYGLYESAPVLMYSLIRTILRM